MISMKKIWNEKAEQLKANTKKEFLKTGRFNSHRVDQYILMKKAAKNCS